MKAMVYRAVEVKLSPGDRVELRSRGGGYNRHVIIKKLVESVEGVYAVFSDHTWRPLSSYGYSWVKVL